MVEPLENRANKLLWPQEESCSQARSAREFHSGLDLGIPGLNPCLKIKLSRGLIHRIPSAVSTDGSRNGIPIVPLASDNATRRPRADHIPPDPVGSASVGLSQLRSSVILAKAPGLRLRWYKRRHTQASTPTTARPYRSSRYANDVHQPWQQRR
jgi:hypothetical protein